MNVQATYQLPPFACAVCLSSKGPCLDLQREDEDNPNRIEYIYLCGECVLHGAREIGKELGFTVMSTLDMAAMEGEMKALAAELETAREDAHVALMARDALLASLGRDPSPEVKPEVKGRVR